MKNKIKSIERTINILEAFTKDEKKLSITKLSNMLEIRKGTIYRFLSTLEDLGYIEQDSETKEYYLGNRAVRLGLHVLNKDGLLEVAKPFLEKLAQDTQETANLSILDGTEILYIDRIESKHILTTNVKIGSRLPVHCTAMGKVLLAFLPNEKLEKIIKEIELKPYTDFTISNKMKFIEELQKVKKQGYATNIEELTKGVIVIGAPVFTYDKKVIAAINIAIPKYHLKEKDEYVKYIPKVLETANKISKKMGYKESI